MKNVDKYKIGYFMPPCEEYDWMKTDHISAPPKWCSVDLRDGNQALIIPMSLDQKLEFFSYLVSLGVKEIEVGFPAASDTEYQFLRALIERDLIPDDVTVQVLTQSREHIIKKTYEALKGAKNAIVHLYNSTSVAQREQVFKKSKEEIIDIAVKGAKMVKEFAERESGNFRFEYSPESFTGTEMEFALEICNRVLDIWEPTRDRKAIINLPATVQMSMPHVYACQVEYMSKNLKYRDAVELSLHPHNDRGTGVADAEMGIIAGADRVEGTLFGNGERTGNVDIITLALNMYAQGVDPGLDFEHINEVREHYERYTNMKVSPRHPYGGKLVFTAFSGSHQDAIAKGMKFREEKGRNVWDVPYLMIDPSDIGRSYDGDVIRINSQSGKGGIGYLMETKYGYDMPAKMREEFGYIVKGISDRQHKEIMPDEVHDIFVDTYINKSAPYEIVDYHFMRKGSGFKAYISIARDGIVTDYTGEGNGRLDAVTNAIMDKVASFSDLVYKEHALSIGSTSKAAAYVGITIDNGNISWGVGVDEDIISASIKALVSAINKTIINA